MRYTLLFFLLVFFLHPVDLSAQIDSFRDTSLFENSILYRKEYRGNVFIHSTGFGASFRKGINENAFKGRFWETSIFYTKELKEIKTTNPWYANSKSYVYGKLNDVMVARIGFGGERRVSRKPFQGGVEVNFNYGGGFSVAVAKPVYLYVIEYTGSALQEYQLAIRKYDPNQHFYENIYGRAPFSDGLNEIKAYPGLYARAGMDFEFGNYDPDIRSLEIGLAFDLFPVAVPTMAFNDPRNLFAHFYIAFSLGKRYN
jgi:hypothetical protein